VDLSDKSEAVVEFRAVFGARGFWRGAVEVQDRAFPADNRFYFTVNVAPPVRVLCINGETGANWYEDESYWFRLALGQQEGSPFRLDVQRPEQVNAADLSRYQVVAMLNVDRVNEALQKALPDFVDNGGSLLLAPADRVERNAFNSTFGDVTPGLLTTAETEPEGEYLVLADINNRHAIVQPLRSSERSDFGAAHFQSHWAADTTQGSTVVLGFDNGDPALMARTIGKGRVALFTSSLDTEWNNLPLQVLYLPLLHETMRYLTMSEERKRSYIIGEPVPMPPGKQFQVRTPVGDEETLEADAEERTFYTRLDLPGWYDFDAGDSREYIAANVAREESDLSSIEPEEFRNAVQNPVTEPEESLEVRTAAVQMQIEQSQQLWWWLLALALALGIGETILANRTYR